MRTVSKTDLIECAAAGLSMSETARKLGLTQPGVSYHARRDGITFQDGRTGDARKRQYPSQVGKKKTGPRELTPLEKMKSDARKAQSRMRKLHQS